MIQLLGSATIVASQLNSWTHADIINAAIAVVAMATLIGTMGMGRKQYRFAIKQINREERKKLYVPVLALMRAEWSRFDAKMLSTFLPSSNIPNLESEENLALLRAKIQSYEFEVEEDLLGSQKVRVEIDAWFKKLEICMKVFEEFQSENLKTNLLDRNADSEFRTKRETLFDNLRASSRDLEEGLEVIQDVIREEVGIASKSAWQKFRLYN